MGKVVRLREGEGWCVLTCSAQKTLRMAERLASEGFDVWTPSRTLVVRKPRMNAKRQVTLSLMPSFIFARFRQRTALLERSSIPGSGFSVFHFQDDIPEIADQELDALRRIEARLALQKRAERSFAKDDAVRVTEGPWCGMEGSVIRSNKGRTLVLVSGRQRVEFLTFNLKPISRINPSQAGNGTAARAA